MDQRTRLLLQATSSGHQQAVARIRSGVEKVITDRWLAMESWRGPEMDAWKNTIIPIVQAAERQVAQVTNAYLTSMSNIVDGTNEPARRLDLSQVTGEATRGVDPAIVYSRPESTVNAALARGSSLSVAVSEGLKRALSLSMTDIQLAKTRTVARQGSGSWFRRTLNGPKNCAKCVIASTQRYHRGTLMPIHPGCDCGVQEEHTIDPGQVINRQLLEATHAAVKDFTGDFDPTTRYVYLDGAKPIPMRGNSTEALDYTDLIVIREHGEYGPTLTWRDDSFTAFDDLAA